MKSPTTSWMRFGQHALAAWTLVASLLACGCSTMTAQLAKKTLHPRVCPTCSARTTADCHCFRPAENAGFCETHWHSLEPSFGGYEGEVIDFVATSHAADTADKRWDHGGAQIVEPEFAESHAYAVQTASYDAPASTSMEASSAYITDKPQDSKPQDSESQANTRSLSVVELHEAYFRP